MRELGYETAMKGLEWSSSVGVLGPESFVQPVMWSDFIPSHRSFGMKLIFVPAAQKVFAKVINRNLM